jgi:hypothetical protein
MKTTSSILGQNIFSTLLITLIINISVRKGNASCISVLSISVGLETASVIFCSIVSVAMCDYTQS